MPIADSEISRALVIAAHPDDSDFGAAGTLATWAAAGIEVTLLCVTRGEQGAQPDADITTIPAVREREQKAASAALGVTDVRFLDGHPDGSVAPTPELVKELVRVIREVRPDRVLAQSPERSYDRIFASHPDHLAAGEAAVQAVYPACENHWAYPDLLAEGLEAWKVRELWIMAHPTPDHAVDVTDQFERKVAALKCHASQTGHRTDLEDILKFWMGNMATRFELGEGRLAEVFKITPINT